MQLRLAVSNRLRDTMGSNYQYVFTETGGTIGRADHNDWILPDAKKYVSSVHASIEARDGGFWLVDTSMNGVFVNGSKTPAGPTEPVELKLGLKLRMGNYHIIVADVNSGLDGDQKTMLRADLFDDNLASVSRDLSMELLVEDDIAEKLDLESLLDDRIASVNASMMTNLDNLPQSLSAPQSNISAQSSSAPEHNEFSEATEAMPTDAVDSAPHSATVHRLPGSAIPETEKNFRALIQGLGVDRSALEMREPEDIAHAVGSALRECVSAIKQMKKDRAESKNALSMQASQQDIDDIAPTEVNDDIVDLLLGRGHVHQKAGEDAAAELKAIRYHNAAMQKATVEAVTSVIEQLHPIELAERFSAHGGGKGLFKATRKASLWDQFERFYDVMSAHQPDELPESMKQEFERAYLAAFRTMERSND